MPGPCPDARSNFLGFYWGRRFIETGPSGNDLEPNGYWENYVIPCQQVGPHSNPFGDPSGTTTGGTDPSTSGIPGNNPFSGDPATDQYYWNEQDKKWRESSSDSPPPPPYIDPHYRFNQLPPSNRPINKIPIGTGTGNQNPCNEAQQTAQNSQIPAATGDPTAELYNLQGSHYTQPQQNGLAAERILADIANDFQDWSSDGSDLEDAFKKAVGTIGPGHTKDDVATALMNALLGPNLITNFPLAPGSLPPDLVDVLDQLAQEIQDGNGDNIDWSAFGDYLNAQASADAAQMQSNYLDPNGTGSNPCGDINNTLQGAKSQGRNSQQRANNALKKLDPNIKPPNVPTGGHYITGLPFRAPGSGVSAVSTTTTVTPTRPSHTRLIRSTPHAPSGSTTATATRGNVAQSRGSQISQGLLHPSGPLISTGPMASDVTRTLRPHLDLRSFGQVMDSLARAQGIVGSLLKPTELPDFDPAVEKVIDIIHNTALNLLNILDDVLSFLDQGGPDPVTGVNYYGPTLTALKQHTEEKLDALNELFHNFPSEPKDPTQKVKWDELRDERNRLEDWYKHTYGDYYGDYP